MIHVISSEIIFEHFASGFLEQYLENSGTIYFHKATDIMMDTSILVSIGYFQKRFIKFWISRRHSYDWKTGNQSSMSCEASRGTYQFPVF